MDILAIRPLADSAVTLDLAPAPGDDAARLVAAATAAIEAAIRSNTLIGAEESAGAFCSVTVHYDPLIIAQSDLVARIATLLAPLGPATDTAGRLWSLPCCYDDALDLPDLAAHLGLSQSEIITLHSETVFRVQALGFLPGLPFLGGLPAPLARPRRTSPRAAVPAGSVAIANRMCVIYPWVSPGGWHIVGTCPVPLFDPARDPPALIAAGDRIRFHPIPATTAAILRAAPPHPATWLVP